MVRLIFHPYTQVGRPICTSGLLRAPPEFPLASPCPSIVYHLLGLITPTPLAIGSHLSQPWLLLYHGVSPPKRLSLWLARALDSLLRFLRWVRWVAEHRRWPLWPFLLWAGPRPGDARQSRAPWDSWIKSIQPRLSSPVSRQHGGGGEQKDNHPTHQIVRCCPVTEWIFSIHLFIENKEIKTFNSYDVIHICTTCNCCLLFLWTGTDTLEAEWFGPLPQKTAQVLWTSYFCSFLFVLKNWESK